jgi:uncharacterized protein YggE
MKMKLIIFITVFMTLVPKVQAQGYDPRRTITVTGTATMKVDPDQVEISMSVETSDMSLDKARGDNDGKTSAIIALLKSIGVGDKNIQTYYLSVEPRYDSRDDSNGEEQPPKFLGYYMTKSIRVILKDISKYEEIVSEVLKLGVNHIYEATFERSDDRKLRDKVRLDALQAAKEKAVALAGLLGEKVGRPITITEGSSRFSFQSNFAYAPPEPDVSIGGVVSGSSIAPGEIEINNSVTVTFELQ